MEKVKIQIYQGANEAWFIQLNGKIICGSHSKDWIMKFAEVVKSEVGECDLNNE